VAARDHEGKEERKRAEKREFLFVTVKKWRRGEHFLQGGSRCCLVRATDGSS
jgi:hypothetical protein